MCWRFVFLQAADSSLNQRDQGRVDEWQQSRKQILELVLQRLINTINLYATKADCTRVLVRRVRLCVLMYRCACVGGS